MLAELVRLNACLTQQAETLSKLQTSVAGLQVKAGVWGLIAGAIPAIAALLLILLKGRG